MMARTGTALGPLVRWWRRSPSFPDVIRTNDFGVSFHGAGWTRALAFRWSEVEEVRAFQSDLITREEACLAFRVGERGFTLGEETEGVDSLTATHAETLPLILTDSRGVGAGRAFTADVRVIYRRGS